MAPTPRWRGVEIILHDFAGVAAGLVLPPPRNRLSGDFGPPPAGDGEREVTVELNKTSQLVKMDCHVANAPRNDGDENFTQLSHTALHNYAILAL